LYLSEEKFKETNLLFKRYERSLEILNRTDISDIDQDELLYVVQSLDRLIGNTELEHLKEKLVNMIDKIVKSRNEEAVKLIVKNLPVLNLPEELSASLRERQSELVAMDLFKELLDDINNHSFGEDAVLLESYSADEFSKEQKERLKKSLQKKFNITVEELLKNSAPDRVRDIDDLHRLIKVANDIKILKENGRVSFLSYKPEMNPENKANYSEKLTLIGRYKMLLRYGVSPGHLAFSAYNENNEPLGFSCHSVDSNDDLRLTIDGRKYYEDEAVCEGTTITYLNMYRFTPGNYKGKAVEWDPLSNDSYSFGFSLSENDIIKLKNGITIKKSIGNSYSLIWIP
jgi:hypothetical protein